MHIIILKPALHIRLRHNSSCVCCNPLFFKAVCNLCSTL